MTCWPVYRLHFHCIIWPNTWIQHVWILGFKGLRKKALNLYFFPIVWFLFSVLLPPRLFWGHRESEKPLRCVFFYWFFCNAGNLVIDAYSMVMPTICTKRGHHSHTTNRLWPDLKDKRAKQTYKDLKQSTFTTTLLFFSAVKWQQCCRLESL